MYVVLKKFKDKNTGTVYEEGTKLQIAPERAEEITSVDTGLIQEVPEDVTEETPEDTPKKTRRKK